MPSTILLSVSLIVFFYSISTIVSAEPDCTLEWSWLDLGGHMVQCRYLNRTDTSTLDRRMISVADPSTILHVDIVGQEITLSQSTLRPFKNITMFSIAGEFGYREIVEFDERAKRSTIESNAFVENKQLKKLKLTEIKFASLENLRGVLQPLFEQVTDMHLSVCSFSDIPSNNLASYDPFQVLREFTKLEEVVMKHIRLTTIPADAFQKSANSLKKLYFEYNQITSIDRNAFRGLSKLTWLDLQNNNIASIEPGTFDDLTSVEYLDLENNRISHLPNILFGKSGNKLERLFLSNNSLISIHPTTFKGLTKLQYIVLRNNNISRIEPGTFDDQIELTTINMDGNRISWLPRNLFEKATKLTKLFIRRNPVRNLSAKNFTRAGNNPDSLVVDVTENEN